LSNSSLDLSQGRALVNWKTGPRWVAFGPAAGATLHRFMLAWAARWPPTSNTTRP